ncbi:hypothetical protein BDF22DRAFT_682678 [Syncephalis plumigaleata]|nr:hypothetical protein BDF22DRAFT_682678 [Syncephalis plumigaleata]
MNAKLLPDTDGATQIVQILRQWLLLKKPTISSETYPIIVFNLTSPKPLRIESASNWNTYLIRYFNYEECKIYAAHFGFSSKNNKLFYNWSLLKATTNGICSIHKDTNVTLPSLARRYGTCHSRLLLFGEMVLVWQYASASNKQALSTNDSNHAANGSSSAQPSNTNQQTKDVQNLFFIHHMDDSSIYYEGTFTEHLPEIATDPDRIIILNGRNLKIVSLESKHTIVDMMIAPNLTYAGFALDRFWVTQHPAGGFYVMDVHNTDKSYHIPCDDVARSKTVAINPHMLMKVIGNKVILWSMNQTV